jgi:hypothetical protein
LTFVREDNYETSRLEDRRVSSQPYLTKRDSNPQFSDYYPMTTDLLVPDFLLVALRKRDGKSFVTPLIRRLRLCQAVHRCGG